MNAAHPYENPTPFTNLIHMLCKMLIPAGLTYAFGSMIARRRQGWAIIIALIPLALKGVKYRAEPADRLLSRNLLIYGVGGVIAPFIGIKLIDLVMTPFM